MFKEEKHYFIIDEFKKYGIIAAMSKKTLGNMADYIENGNSLKNRNEFKRILDLEDKIIIHATQTHSNNILVINEFDNIENYLTLTNYDGFITKRKDIIFFTYYADCLPIFVIDIKKSIIGIAHSGWKGSFEKILENLTNAFKNNFNSNIDDLKIGIGIGISVLDYEVKKEFYEKFFEKFPDISNRVFKFINDKIYFDNTKFNYILAKKIGYKEENIIIDYKGVKNANLFSHRLDKENIGRSAAVIAFK